jgi:hypothetical protein
MLTLPDRYLGEENRTRYLTDWQDFFTAQSISMIQPRNMDNLRANPNAPQNPLFVPDPSGYWAPDFAIVLDKKTYGAELSTIGRHEEHFDDARYFPTGGKLPIVLLANQPQNNPQCWIWDTTCGFEWKPCNFENGKIVPLEQPCLHEPLDRSLFAVKHPGNGQRMLIEKWQYDFPGYQGNPQYEPFEEVA